MWMHSVDYGWLNTRQQNFFIERQGGGITPFSACRYLHPFWRYKRLRYKVVQNWAEFSVFATKIWGVQAPKFVPKLSHLPRCTSWQSFVRLLLLVPKLFAFIFASWGNFWIFIVKNCWCIPVPRGVYVRKHWSFSSTCTNLSASTH